MTVFPRLSSGAITQYPSTFVKGQAVQVLRFLDGSDQRCLLQGNALRSWQIRLELLNDAEIQQLETFFESLTGDYALFIFPDPITGENVLNCRLGAPTFMSDYVITNANATAFWVLETNG